MDKKNTVNKKAVRKPTEVKKFSAISELDSKQKNDLAAWAYEVYKDFYKSNSGAPAEPEQVAEIVSRLSQKLTDKKMAVAEKPLQVYVNSKLANFQKKIEKELAM